MTFFIYTNLIIQRWAFWVFGILSLFVTTVFLYILIPRENFLTSRNLVGYNATQTKARGTENDVSTTGGNLSTPWATNMVEPQGELPMI